MAFILWLIAVILVIAGIVQIVRGALLFGIVLIVVGLLVGPGGVSIFTYAAPGRTRAGRRATSPRSGFPACARTRPAAETSSGPPTTARLPIVPGSRAVRRARHLRVDFGE